jgi:natural product biosynthesis luciferase-like monooxygenase protein
MIQELSSQEKRALLAQLVQQKRERLTGKSTSEPIASTTMEFSLFYFSGDETEFTDNKYRLFFEGSKFADLHDFTAIWLPERHFHPFGGLYPAPSVLCAALAPITEKIRLRAGSVVMPLHNPVRVAEEWSVVDNISKGRVDLAFARGWNASDFTLMPEAYKNSAEILFSGVQVVQKLWRGEKITLRNGLGEPVEVRIYPSPQQQELPVWITCSGGGERFVEAGAIGANVLTALLFQEIEELAEKITLYRQARAANGFNPDTGKVTLMLHTFVDRELELVRDRVRAPFTEYLKTSVNLWSKGKKNVSELTPKEQEKLVSYAFERYFQTNALFGTPASCHQLVERLAKIGINEIACLIDFGIDVNAVLESLNSLNILKQNFQNITDSCLY